MEKYQSSIFDYFEKIEDYRRDNANKRNELIDILIAA